MAVRRVGGGVEELVLASVWLISRPGRSCQTVEVQAEGDHQPVQARGSRAGSDVADGSCGSYGPPAEIVSMRTADAFQACPEGPV